MLLMPMSSTIPAGGVGPGGGVPGALWHEEDAAAAAAEYNNIDGNHHHHHHHHHRNNSNININNNNNNNNNGGGDDVYYDGDDYDGIVGTYHNEDDEDAILHFASGTGSPDPAAMHVFSSSSFTLTRSGGGGRSFTSHIDLSRGLHSYVPSSISPAKV